MSWKRTWVVCQHPNHWKNKKYDKNGQQDGWQCNNCGYSVCKYCDDPSPKACPKCGRK